MNNSEETQSENVGSAEETSNETETATDATNTDVADAESTEENESSEADANTVNLNDIADDETTDSNEASSEESATNAQAEGAVAQIGNTTYETLDEAIATAEDGDEIILLADATVSETLDKVITIDGQGEYTLTSTNVRYGFSTGSHVTFENLTANFEYTIEIENPTYTSDLSLFYVNGDTDFTFENSTVNITNTGATERLHAFYYDNSKGTITLDNTEMTITGFPEDAFEWAEETPISLIVKNQSRLVSNNNRAGITGTWDVTVSDSTLEVLNSTGNGSNGSNFYITSSTVIFDGNGTHGLSAGELQIKDSTVTSTNNGAIGIAVNNGLSITDNSVVTVSGNATNPSYGYAAVRLYNNHDFAVDSTSTLRINNNYNTGLYVRQGNLTVEDGAVLEIMGNVVNNNLLSGYGGGLYVGYGDNYDPTVTLPADAKIYNNHATNAGDDIYVSEGVNGPTLTFGQTGDNWSLDGDPDCDGEWHMIDGWYDDSVADETGEGGRWMAHAEDESNNHVEEFTDFNDNTGLATVTGALALKAAHGVDATPAVAVDVKGLKIVENADEDTVFDQMFQFYLTGEYTENGESVDAPLPDGAGSGVSVAADQAGEIDFGTIVFNENNIENAMVCDDDDTCSATFTYTVREEADVDNVTNDPDSEKTFTVTLTTDGSSDVPTVSVEADESAAGYDDGTLFVFTNTYTAPEEPAESTPSDEETPSDSETTGTDETTDTKADGDETTIAQTGAAVIVPAVVVVLLLTGAVAGTILRRRNRQ